MCVYPALVNQKHTDSGRNLHFLYIYQYVTATLSRELRKSARILALTILMFSLVYKLGEKSLVHTNNRAPIFRALRGKGRFFKADHKC